MKLRARARVTFSGLALDHLVDAAQQADERLNGALLRHQLLVVRCGGNEDGKIEDGKISIRQHIYV